MPTNRPEVVDPQTLRKPEVTRTNAMAVGPDMGGTLTNTLTLLNGVKTGSALRRGYRAR